MGDNGPTETTPPRGRPHDADADELRSRVRTRYAAAARAATAGGDCCAPGSADDVRFGAGRYSVNDLAGLPADAVAAGLGCGDPLAVAHLGDGETVLDLGSGGGMDVLLSARRVGPTGRVYGLDMTEEMLELARANAAEAGADNVEFLRGHMEAVPLPDRSIDVVISNCVINLSVDKRAVFAEIHRVLRPGGRVGISDVVAEDRLTTADRAARGDHAACMAGALGFTEYREHLAAAGFTDVSLTPTHEVADGMHAVTVKATRPTTAS
ncbi:arsenite methyltransferase [Thermomonospora umbrina]|uniref:Arsenite methyltransferase n=1 Tax=Thermomonospora umbrina TaxID=111806 RepID=A0A3D9T5E9_9ACTN|nr:arsenite methyltransferase [Thermomonospora umbrina]REE99934.1 methyltransferase family protein [Thermomonospora umbrina]